MPFSHSSLLDKKIKISIFNYKIATGGSGSLKACWKVSTPALLLKVTSTTDITWKFVRNSAGKKKKK